MIQEIFEWLFGDIAHILLVAFVGGYLVWVIRLIVETIKPRLKNQCLKETELPERPKKHDSI